MVREYLTGYQNYSFQELQYTAAGAVPLPLDAYLAVQTHILALANLCIDDHYQQALLYRDLCAFAYLWETAQRGKECGRLLSTDLFYQGVLLDSAWPDILRGELRAGATVGIESSLGTKMRRHGHPGVLELATAISPDGSGWFLSYLPLYGMCMEASGNAIVTWLFRPMDLAAPGTFRQAPVAASTLNKRLQKYLQAQGRWNGESLHGLRRGRVQAEYAAGAGIADLARRHLWSQTETLELYLHTARHRRRLRVTPTESGVPISQCCAY